jgi:hypothetical protein
MAKCSCPGAQDPAAARSGGRQESLRDWRWYAEFLLRVQFPAPCEVGHIAAELLELRFLTASAHYNATCKSVRTCAGLQLHSNNNQSKVFVLAGLGIASIAAALAGAANDPLAFFHYKIRECSTAQSARCRWCARLSRSSARLWLAKWFLNRCQGGGDDGQGATCSRVRYEERCGIRPAQQCSSASRQPAHPGGCRLPR